MKASGTKLQDKHICATFFLFVLAHYLSSHMARVNTRLEVIVKSLSHSKLRASYCWLLNHQMISNFELQEILELLSTYPNTRCKFDMVIHLEGQVVNKFYVQGNFASRFNPAYLQQVLLEAMLTENNIIYSGLCDGPFLPECQI